MLYGAFGQTDNDIDEAVNLGQADLEESEESEDVQEVTVTVHLNAEWVENLHRYSDCLADKPSLSPTEDAVFEILDQILESASNQGVRVRE